MTNLPEHAVLRSLGLTPAELAAAVESGELPRPFDVRGESLWPLSAITSYIARRSALPVALASGDEEE